MIAIRLQDHEHRTVHDTRQFQKRGNTVEKIESASLAAINYEPPGPKLLETAILNLIPDKLRNCHARASAVRDSQPMVE